MNAIKVNKRIRVNARLPDPDGKYRDEITQEFTVEMDHEDHHDLDEIIATIDKRMATLLGDTLQKIKELGGRDYT